MKKSKTKKTAIAIYIISIIILLGLIILFALSTYRNYSKWEQYHNYFKNPNPKIQSWMSVKTISQHFNLPYGKIYSVLGNTTKINYHISLNRFCIDYGKNCSQILTNLNNLIK